MIKQDYMKWNIFSAAVKSVLSSVESILTAIETVLSSHKSIGALVFSSSAEKHCSEPCACG